MGEASSMDFGLWFFRKEYNSSIWGILKKEEEWEKRSSEAWDTKGDVEPENNTDQEWEIKVDGKLEEVVNKDDKMPAQEVSYHLIPEPPQACNINTDLVVSIFLNVFLLFCLLFVLLRPRLRVYI